jgi:hypothetical protein
VLQFGDISKKLDQRAKSDVRKLTGNEEYKFGDLSRWADSQIKEKVTNYTGKEMYQVCKHCMVGLKLLTNLRSLGHDIAWVIWYACFISTDHPTFLVYRLETLQRKSFGEDGLVNTI